MKTEQSEREETKLTQSLRIEFMKPFCNDEYYKYRENIYIGKSIERYFFNPKITFASFILKLIDINFSEPIILKFEPIKGKQKVNIKVTDSNESLLFEEIRPSCRKITPFRILILPIRLENNRLIHFINNINKKKENQNEKALSI